MGDFVTIAPGANISGAVGEVRDLGGEGPVNEAVKAGPADGVSAKDIKTRTEWWQSG